MGKAKTAARLGFATAKGKVKGQAAKASAKAGEKLFKKGYGGPSATTKAKKGASRGAKAGRTKARRGAEQAEFAGKRAAGQAKNKAGAAATRTKGAGPTVGAGPNKTRSATVRGVNVTKNTYGSGRKRTTVVSVMGKQTGKASAKGKTIAITPKKRAVGYGAGAGTGAVGAGGYVTYKRRTKSGKTITVRRKK